MLSEVAKVRSPTLIMWKTDRLGRDKCAGDGQEDYTRGGVRDPPAGRTPQADGSEAVLIESLMDSIAEYYSRQLS